MSWFHAWIGRASSAKLAAPPGRFRLTLAFALKVVLFAQFAVVGFLVLVPPRVRFPRDPFRFGVYCLGLALTFGLLGAAILLAVQKNRRLSIRTFIAFAVGVPLTLGVGVPLYLRSGGDHTESRAISNLRTLNTAEQQYRSTEGSEVFGTLVQLSAPSPPFVDSLLGTGTQGGYLFDLEVFDGGGRFTCRASPDPKWARGYRCFWTDTSGVIRAAGTEDVDANSTPVD